MRTSIVVLSYVLIIVACGYSSFYSYQDNYRVTGAAAPILSSNVINIANYQKDLTQGHITGAAVPIIPSVVTNSSIHEVYQNPWLNQQLIKAIKANNLSIEDSKKAIMIKDSAIEPNSYKVTYFEIPKDAKKIKINLTRSTEKLQTQKTKIETRLFVNMPQEEINKIFGAKSPKTIIFEGQEIPLVSTHKLSKEGINYKSGSIKLDLNQPNKAALVTIYAPDEESRAVSYAYLVTFDEES